MTQPNLMTLKTNTLFKILLMKPYKSRIFKKLFNTILHKPIKICITIKKMKTLIIIWNMKIKNSRTNCKTINMNKQHKMNTLTNIIFNTKMCSKMLITTKIKFLLYLMEQKMKIMKTMLVRMNKLTKKLI